MDETMLSAKCRFKVLARCGGLHLIPDMINVPNITGCVSFTATGHVFTPLIILPNKKNLRSLEDFVDLGYFASSRAGWVTKKHLCLLLFIAHLSIITLSFNTTRRITK